MNVFESINNTSDKAVDTAETYIQKSREYFKLKIFYQLTYNISMLGKVLMVGAVLFIGFLFLAIALAIYLGQLLANVALGYLIVGGLFFVFALGIYLARHLIDAKVISKVQTNFFKS